MKLHCLLPPTITAFAPPIIVFLLPRTVLVAALPGRNVSALSRAAGP